MFAQAAKFLLSKRKSVAILKNTYKAFTPQLPWSNPKFFVSSLFKLRLLNLMDVARISPTYYFEDIYRYVKTYHHTYKTHTKKRWIDMRIIDMFSKEFQAYDYEYYVLFLLNPFLFKKQAILEGRIRVNDKKVSLDYKLKDNDRIEHDAVRIEPPVYNAEIEIVYQDNDFVVINKPPSIPVHVCGSYLFNTVVNLMKYAYKFPEIYSVHRLDKLTSGLLVLAKSQDLAFNFQEDLKKKEVGKIYLARVLGDFPCGVGEVLVVEKSIYCVSAKLGKYDFCKTEEEEKIGKSAKTAFKKVWYDPVSNSSLLECQLFTGRTHQIRVHCYSVGCSIINDVNYGGVFIGNPYQDDLRKKLGIPKKDENTDSGEISKEERKIEEKNESEKNQEDKDDKDEKDEKDEKDDLEPEVVKKVKEDPFKASEQQQKAEHEEEKKNNADIQNKNEEKISDKKIDFFGVNDEEQTYVMEIWLHSWKYQYKDKSFETPLPYWTNKDFKFDIKEFRKTDSWSHK